MKYKFYLAIFLLSILSIGILSNELSKPKSMSKRKNKGKSKGRKRKSLKPKTFKRKPKFVKNSFESPVDLDVLIRFKFAKYGTNVLANFVSGILSSFYNNQFVFLQQQEGAQKVIERHIKCIRKETQPFFGNSQITRSFENKFIFGGLYPLKQQVKHYFVFQHRYRVLRRLGKISRIVRRLKRVTGTFQRNQKYYEQQYKLKTLFGQKRREFIEKLKKRISRRKIKRITKSSYAKFKYRTMKKKVDKMKKSMKISVKAWKIIGKHATHITGHAKFMTYAFRKIWFYTSFFTKKVLSCGVSAASNHREIQKSFLQVYRRNQRVACPYKYIDVLTMMPNNYTVRSAFSTIFHRLLVKGVKNRLIHRLQWFKIGQAIFSAHQALEKLCPWF